MRETCHPWHDNLHQSLPPGTAGAGPGEKAKSSTLNPKPSYAAKGSRRPQKMPTSKQARAAGHKRSGRSQGPVLKARKRMSQVADVPNVGKVI